MDELEFNSIDEAKDYKLRLVEKLENIEAQLGNRDQTKSDGARLSAEEYWQWRKRAVAAKRHTVSTLRRVKEVIRQLEQRVHDFPYQHEDLTIESNIILAASTLLSKLVEEGAINEDELVIVHAIRDLARKMAV